MFGHVVAVQQGRAGGDGPGGEVFGKLDPDRGVGDEPGLRDPVFDLTADVGGVPRRPPHAQPGHHQLDGLVPVQRAHRRRRERHWSGGVAVAEPAQLLVPRCDHRRPVLGHHLVRAGLRPRPPVPRLPQPRPRLLTRMLGPPRGLEPLEVAADLRRPRAEPRYVRRQLDQLPRGGVEGEPALGQCPPEAGVGRHGGVADAVDRLQVVSRPDRVHAAPCAGGEHPGVDLQVQMPVRVAGPGGVVPQPTGIASDACFGRLGNGVLATTSLVRVTRGERADGHCCAKLFGA